MTPHPMPQQSPARAPAPPIPALPAAPGAATGAQGAAQGAQQAADQAQRAAADAQRVADEAQRIAEQAGQPAIAGDAPPPPGQLTTSTGLPVNPEAIIRESIPIVGMSLAMVVSIFVGWPLARAFARRMDKRVDLAAANAAQLQPQIRQLQESLDAMAVELERIGEAQRFQAKLLAERSTRDAADRG